jgi:DNA-binding PadR family transcriptional regulator
MMHIPKAHLDLLGLAVLTLVVERPRHPYEIARLLRERGKDSGLDSSRALYHAVARLERQGLIEASETQREGRRPERTVYRATDRGIEEVGDWVRELVTIPHEQRTFYAALSHLAVLTPDEAAAALEHRIVLLEAEIAVSEALVRSLTSSGGLPRLFIVESEYLRHQHQAEVEWIRSAVREIRNKAIEWPDWLVEVQNRIRQASTAGASLPFRPPTVSDPATHSQEP